MFKNMKLRYRILLGYAVPLALFMAVAIIVSVNVERLSESYDLAQQTFKILNQTKDAEIGVAVEMRAIRGYLLAKDETSLRISEDGKKQFDKAIEALRGGGYRS